MEKKFEKTNLDMLNRFKKNVLKQSINKEVSSDETIVNRNYSAMFFCALIVLATNLFWVINMIKNHAMNWENIGLYATMLLVFSSIIMIFLTLFQVGNSKFKHIATLTYYIILLIASCMLTISTTSRAEANGDDKMRTISLGSFYIFIFIVFPLPYKVDYITLTVGLIASYLIPHYTPGKTCYSLTTYGLLYAYLACGYLYFGYMYKKMFEKDAKIKQLNRSLLDYSFVDILTETLNRRSLDTYWKKICEDENVKSCGLIFFDIDNFKNYNDNYSHAKGDVVLKNTCAIAIESIKDEGYLFRYGGEEFLFVTINNTENQLLNIGLKVKNAIYDANIKRDDIKTYDRITISVGCALIEKENMSETDYITEVDKQLYIGKNGTKNCVTFKDKTYN